MPVFLLVLLTACTRDPKVQAQRYLDNGNKFFAKEKYKEASIMYRKALQKDLRFGEAYYRQGLTDLKLAAYGDAVRMLRRAVDLEPNNSDAASKLADLLFLASTQSPQQATALRGEVKDIADKLVARDPHSFDGHRLEGQLKLMDKDPAGAVKEFAQANAAKPLQTDLVLSYFQALVANNQFPEAEKLAQNLIAKDKTYAPIYDLLYYNYARQNRLADAENLLKLKIANNPQNASDLLQLAGFYYVSKRQADMDAIIAKMTDEKKFPEGHLLAGDFFFFRLREFAQAEQQYQAAIKAFPKDKAIYQKRLVELYASTNRAPEANRLLADVLKDNPKDSDAVAMRAALMLTTGNRDQINQAANDLQSLVTKSPQNHLLRFNLARALLAKGQTEQASLQLEEAIKIRPDYLPARELLARVYISKGDGTKALKAAEDILSLDPKNLEGHLLRSTALIGVGDQAKAGQELDYITKNYPDNAQAKYLVGYLDWQEKNYKQAEQVFGDLYKANPKDYRGLAGLTETLVSEKRVGDALAKAQQALQADPGRADLKLFLANLDVRAAKYDDAIQLYQDLVAKNPRDSTMLFRLAETERRKGDMNAAIDTFRKASQANPNDPSSLLQISLILEGTGRRAQAQPLYEQILKIQPDNPVALNNLAYIKAEQGVDLDQALTMAQRALQKDPNSLQISDTLGWIYIKKNLSEDAVRVFKGLVEKEPGDPMFHYHYGMALLQKGDRPSAKRELQAAIKDNPPKDEIGKINQLLATL